MKIFNSKNINKVPFYNIVFGIVIIAISFFTLLFKQFPIIWIGGFLWGIILIIRGLISLEGTVSAERVIPKAFKITIIILLWSASIIPFLGLFSLLYIADDGTLPGFDELENPKTNLASVIYTADAVELGKYYHQNRTNVGYNELSPWLIKALIATEDERYYDHSGVDVRALGRVVKGVVSGNSSQGGGSTI